MNHENPGLILIPLLMIALPVFFMGITSLLGLLSGWASLARYRAAAPSQPPLHRQYLISGSVGWVSYNSVLSLSLYPDSLYLAVMPLFRAGHPCLLIPREEIQNARPGKTWFGLATYTFQVGDVQFKLLGSGLDQQLDQWIHSSPPKI